MSNPVFIQSFIPSLLEKKNGVYGFTLPFQMDLMNACLTKICAELVKGSNREVYEIF
jgi:hypothetical protein